MNRIDARLSQLGEQGRRALIPYVTAGYPGPDATVPVLHAAVEAGADLLEVGMPFSDVMADGPVIQEACATALARGMSLEKVVAMVAGFRRDDDRTPVVMMGYMNPLERRGFAQLVGEAAAEAFDEIMANAARNAPEARRIFLDLLLKHGNPERGLRRMNELGALGAYLPEFKPIVAMMQYNMYHSYTVDEHIIQCIAQLAMIEKGDLVEDLPIASRILKEGGVNRKVLYVALLLHDIGKGRDEDHSILGARIARWLPAVWLRRIVIGFGDKTPMASPDHWQAMQITDAAVFYSRLTKWDEHFDGLPVHAISAQLYFRLAFEPATLDGYASHFTVDIGDTLQAKLDSIRCYQTQFPPEKEYVFDRVRGAALTSGAAAGFTAGEVFVKTRPIAVDDLVKATLFTY